VTPGADRVLLALGDGRALSASVLANEAGVVASIEREVIIGDGTFRLKQAQADRLSAPGRDVDYQLSDYGARWLQDFGVDVDALRGRRRPLIRYCLDWSEQRHHLAGSLGAALAHTLLERGWLSRAPRSRAVVISDVGRSRLIAAIRHRALN